MKRLTLLSVLILSACGQNGAGTGKWTADEFSRSVSSCTSRSLPESYCTAYYLCASEAVSYANYPKGGLTQCADAWK